jgi:hypothetical protein
MWLTPVILAIQEAEIRNIAFWSQPRQIVPRDPILKENKKKKNKKNKPSQKRAGGVAQGVGPEFKPQFWREKKKKKNKAETG